ncbi:MAG: redoxin domain-containing protein [Bacteroidales bacterium]|nr:redoxin domain-containing protein [Bacteroidales bacterium]
MKHLNSLLLVLLAIIAFSCGKSEPDNTEPTPVPKPTDKIELATGTDPNPVIATDGGTLSVTFNASTSWSAQAVNDRADAWCSVSPTSGNAGAATITITAKPNTEPNDRSASINITAGTAQQTIKVTQKQKDALTVTASTFEVPAEGNDINIEVKANINVTYKIDQQCSDWIKYVSTKALKTSTLTFAVSKNESTDKREGRIIIGEGLLSDTIKIFQAGEAPSIVLNKDEYMAKSEGETFAIEVSSNVDVSFNILHPDGSPIWLEECKTKTMSTNTYWFTASANEWYDNREAKIIFTDKENNLSDTVKVIQLQKDAIVLAKSVYEIDNIGGNITVEVAHNVDYKINIGAEWITQVETKGLETDYLTFDIAENKEYDNREAIITFTSADGSITQEVKVCQTQANALIISQKEHILNSSGGDVTIEVRSNVDFSVESPDCDWIHEVKTKGLTTHTLNYKVDENTSYDSRKASIVITNAKTGEKDSVEISQMQKDAIVLAKNEYEFGVEGGNLEFDIHTNVDVAVEISVEAKSWITRIETRGLETRSLCFSVATCDEEDNREGRIKLSGGDVEQTITVKQSGLREILDIEREALIAFYNATGGDNWTNNTNWCSDKPVSEWYGIETNHRGLVSYIQLYENNLAGAIPESIGNLVHLLGITLGNNSLSGELPSTIGNLAELSSLWLENNNLSGCIPESICNLRKLIILSLDINKFSGELPASIGNLTELRVFSAMNNNLTGKIPESIGNLKNLETLYLSSNQLSGELPATIGNLTNIKHFDVAYNNLSGAIPESISEMKSLNTIFIRGNYFTGKVPECLMQMDTWPTKWHEILDQRGDGFSQEGLIIPAPKFRESTIDGGELDYSVYSENEYTILYHYFDWCNWIYDFTPILVKLYDGYKNKGLEVITFSIDGTVESNKKFAETFNTKWPYITLDNNPEMFNAHTWISPGVCVVDKEGYIIFNNLTYDWRDLEGFLYEILGPPEPTGPSEDPQFYESTDYSKDGEVKQLQSATKGKGIDIILMGDAYTDRLVADGTYDRTMHSVMEMFFTVEPYKSFRDYFNVYSVTAVSKNEIYSQHTETAFKGYFIEDTRVAGDDHTVYSYALKAIGEERMDEEQASMIVIMNSDVYAGTCYMYTPSTEGDWSNGLSVSYFPIGSNGPELLEGLIHHEAGGHGFAKLADEYTNNTDTISEEEANSIRSEQTDWGWWKNVDFTADPTLVRWAKFISDERYKYDGLGAFEGGLTYLNGVWRPTVNSIMRYNNEGFNAPSREAIYYRIHKLAYGPDWEYDYEKFVEWDAINRNDAPNPDAVSSQVLPLQPMEPLHPPVVVNRDWKKTISN